MNGASKRLVTPRPRPAIGAAVFFGAVLLLSAPGLRADIFRWVDEAGTIHFTDDPFSIPPSQRAKARVVVKERPASPETSAAPPHAAPAEVGPAEALAPVANEREELEARIEQLRAKIAAKEQLIERVDAKRSLATNPLRNRFVDPADLELYGKYKAELPADRELLLDLETRLERLR